jgi:hypothetical protein
MQSGAGSAFFPAKRRKTIVRIERRWTGAGYAPEVRIEHKHIMIYNKA